MLPGSLTGYMDGRTAAGCQTDLKLLNSFRTHRPVQRSLLFASYWSGIGGIGMRWACGYPDTAMGTVVF